MTDATGRGPLDPGQGDDLAQVAIALDGLEPSRLQTGFRAASTAVTGACAAAALTSLVAAVLAAWAWGGDAVGVTVAAALLLAGAGSAVYVAIRVRALADALAHPREVVDQARDLVSRAKGSPELGQLARQLRGRAATAQRATRFARARRVVSMGRAATAVIGLAEPDPDRHRHLIAFQPERVRFLWLAITTGLWVWLLAGAVATVAAIALLVQLVT